MPVDHVAIAAGQYRDLEAEFADAAAHAINDSIILAGIAGVENQLVNRPIFDARLCGDHSTPRQSTDLVWRILSEGALCARLSNKSSQYNSTTKCFRFKTLRCGLGSGGEAQSKHKEGFDQIGRA